MELLAQRCGLRAPAVGSPVAVQPAHYDGDAIAACLDVQRPRDHNARVQQLCGIAVAVECCFALWTWLLWSGYVRLAALRPWQ